MKNELYTDKARAETADLIQDASNLSGVARELVRQIDAVRQEKQSSDAPRHDPCVKYILLKMMDMCRVNDTFECYSDVSRGVGKMRRGDA